MTSQPIILDRHARRRLKDRDVTLEEVELTLRQPDRLVPSVKNRMNAFRQLGPDKAIRVTYIDEGMRLLVITVVRRKRFAGGGL